MTRVFVIHAPEDYLIFDRIKDQAKTANLAVELDRMQVKQPWVPGWKGQCRTRIYNCGGAIVLLSKNTNQGGIAWELECAQAFDLPMLGVHTDKSRGGTVPEELRDSKIIDWNWVDIARFIQTLGKGTSAFA